MELQVEPEVKIRILAVDEHLIFLDGLRSRLKDVAKEIEIVAQANDGDTAYQMASTLMPHVVLMEMSLNSSKLSGLEAARKIKEDFPETKVLILTADDSSAAIMGALRAGASGYLLKTISIEELKEAIITVMNNGSALSPSVAQKVLMVISRPVTENCTPTARELQILEYMELGITNKEMAKKLFLSPRTIEVHMSHIFQKLGVSSRTEAVVRALRIGLLSLPPLEKAV